MQQESEEELYVCVAVYEASSDTPNFSPLYEERFILLRASSEEEARNKANVITQASTHDYVNIEGHNVRFSCKCIVDVALAIDDTMRDGAEIYGRYFKDFEAYKRFELLKP